MTAWGWRAWLTLWLWLLFLGGSILLLVADALWQIPILFSLLGLAFLFLIELLLLLRYARSLAQWRGIFLLWMGYSLARSVSAWPPLAEHPSLIIAALLATLYAMFGGWFATIVLAIRRDVSVAYLFLFFAITPLVFRAGIRAAGGVLPFLRAETPGDTLRAFTISETAVMALVLLPPLALLSFIPHFLRLWLHEWRRTPL